MCHAKNKKTPCYSNVHGYRGIKEKKRHVITLRYQQSPITKPELDTNLWTVSNNIKYSNN